MSILISEHSRHLTVGEKAFILSVFSISKLNLNQLKIFNSEFLPFQGDDVAIAPSGNIYFEFSNNRGDLSIAGAGSKTHFVHEITHLV